MFPSTCNRRGTGSFPSIRPRPKCLARKVMLGWKMFREKVDIVDIFRRSEFVPEIVDVSYSHRRAGHLDARGSHACGSRRTRSPRGTLRGDELLYFEGTHQALPPACRLIRRRKLAVRAQEIISRVCSDRSSERGSGRNSDRDFDRRTSCRYCFPRRPIRRFPIQA